MFKAWMFCSHDLFALKVNTFCGNRIFMILEHSQAIENSLGIPDQISNLLINF
jgi:hypothetical protein